MVITNKRVIQTSRQITAHAFCGDCERRFNSGGETWLLEKLATLTAFPLRDMALATIPINDEPDFKAFSCDAIPDFQVQKIVHLALGIFWKSAVRTWNMIDGAINRIDLGPYQEPVRQFVYGTGPFPENMYLMAYLDASNPPLVAMSSPRRFLSEKFHLFIFYLNGLQCVLLSRKSKYRKITGPVVSRLPLITPYFSCLRLERRCFTWRWARLEEENLPEE